MRSCARLPFRLAQRLYAELRRSISTVGERPDPRISHAHVVSGPNDLVGQTLLIVDEVTINREVVHIPRPLAGITELVAVAEAEKRAEELRERLLGTLVTRGGGKWQPDTTLVIEMRSAAEVAVTAAVVGLEAFSSHHLSRNVDPATGKLLYDGRHLTPQEVRDAFSLDQRYKDVLPSLMQKVSPGRETWWVLLRRVQALAALTRHAITEPVERKGLSGQRSLAERFYTGEYRGVTVMLFDTFEYYSPNWVPEDLRGIAS
jgi:hypothetical protein